MAFPHFLITLLFALALASTFDLAASQVLKAKVSCFDCTTPNNNHQSLSEIKVSVKCENVRKAVVASTEEDGSFKVELPRDPKNSAASDVKCVAKLLGGPNQLYASEKDKASLIVKTTEANTYTISTPLGFLTSCPQNKLCKFGSSETIDIPLPPEWGFAPSSYYIPFFPIIGIP
ncbi:uncharacterized protein LOC129314595 [Prosopis cineraria]|uniref:uncharacterized protein LOC129314595 n=1 Tax=Prosopis cineraria TaxID=364024 RepID=UPI00240EA2DF|nr:uncharacterized protein LOC129314595 [Prosopis cineraria]